MKIRAIRKKRICKVFIFIAAAVINILTVLSYISTPVVISDRISFQIDYVSDTANNVQLFYSQDKQPVFSEDKSVSTAYTEPSKVVCISAEIPADTTYIRIDMGETGGSVSVSNPAVSSNGGKGSLNISAGAAPVLSSCIKSITTQNDGSLLIITDNGDPYFVISAEAMNINGAFSVIEKKISEKELFKTVVICFITDFIAFLLIRFLKDLIDLPMKIVREKKIFSDLVKNDFHARFAGSYFGVFWAFFQPVITMLLYWFVFQVGLRAGNVTTYPFILFLMSGMIPWLYFSEALSGGANSLNEYSYLVKKVVFNIEMLPAIKVASALFVHVFFVAFLAVICVVYGYFPSLYWLQIFYYIFCTAFLVLGLSYIAASCTAFFKDTTQIVNIILTVGVWITPVMWNPVGTISETLRTIFKINPVYYIVDGFRDALLAKVWFWEKPLWTLGFWAISITIYILGVKLFKKLKIHFADVL